MRLPPPGGGPTADATDAVRDATAACRAVSSITAEVAVRGSVGGNGLRARLLAGLASPSSARLEAAAPFGQPVFIFVARNNDATLLLPRDGRILEHGQPAAVLEAVAGVPLDAADLRGALTGCASTPRPNAAMQPADEWRIVPDGPGEVYLRRDARAGRWQIVAAVHRGAGASGWRAEYRDFQPDGAAAGLPRAVRLVSEDGKRFDLRLTLSQVEINVPLDADAFRVQAPPRTEPITLDELKRSGPLSRGK